MKNVLIIDNILDLFKIYLKELGYYFIWYIPYKPINVPKLP